MRNSFTLPPSRTLRRSQTQQMTQTKIRLPEERKMVPTLVEMKNDLASCFEK